MQPFMLRAQPTNSFFVLENQCQGMQKVNFEGCDWRINETKIVCYCFQNSVSCHFYYGWMQLKSLHICPALSLERERLHVFL